MKEQEQNVSELKTEIQRLKTTGTEKKVSTNRIQELEEEIRRLKEDLQKEAEEKKDILTEKAQLEKENEEVGDVDLVHQFFSYWFSRYQIKKILFFTEAKNYEFYHRESTARERKRGGWRHGL